MKSKTASSLVGTALRRQFVMMQRVGGAGYNDIVVAAIKEFGLERLPKGWDERFAYKDVKRELDAINRDRREAGEEIINLELKRLDMLWMTHIESALKGDLDAFGAVMKVMERRAKLLGLDAATRVKLDVTRKIDPTELLAMLMQYDVETLAGVMNGTIKLDKLLDGTIQPNESDVIDVEVKDAKK